MDNETHAADVVDLILNKNKRQRPDPEQAGPQALVQSSSEFVAALGPVDYVIDDLFQRGFFYSFTGKTGAGKTSILLLFSACVGIGRAIGKNEVSQGGVLYFAGENPDDTRMRWIAMAQNFDFDIETIPVNFIPGVFNIGQILGRVKEEMSKRGDIVLVIVDTSAAYFPGDDENSNAQAGAHARQLRELKGLPGNPCVIAACHPVKNATDDNLVPRGGGAYLAEVDGNATARNDDSAVEMHWQGKFRGPDFAPLYFTLRTVTHERLKTTKGKLLPTVIALPLSDIAREELQTKARGETELLLRELDRHPKASRRELTAALGWKHHSKADRMIKKLAKFKLVEIDHDGVAMLTSKGRKAIEDE